MSPDYDIAIIGAGVVGATLACLSGEAGMRVALVDSRAPSLGSPPRVSAINAATQRILAAIGVWEDLHQNANWRPSAYSRMRVWDAQGWGEVSFDAAELGLTELGWIASDYHLREVLIKRAETFPKVQRFCPAQLVAFTVEREGVSVQLDTSTLSAQLLVGADGGRSQVRSLALVSVQGWSYGQKALVTTIESERPHENTAWQRFLATGPVALLPLSDGRSSVVWSTHSHVADELCAMSATAFSEQLTDATAARLGCLTVTDPIAGFPLIAQWADRYVLSRIALIGDSAHVVHPLAGQGANLGMRDVAVLARLLTDAARRGEDLGQRQLLRRYQRQCKSENLLSLLAFDGLGRLFSNRLPGLTLARNAGLNAVNFSTTIKSILSGFARGDDVDLAWLDRL